ncbi:MAG: matrixin family metalloprotease, partial [Burkholderiaceae bacterium]
SATESGNDNGILEVGETWSYTATHTVTQDEINAGTTLVNVATGDTDQTAPKSDDASTMIVQMQSNGLIAPTGATIQQYINGTAMRFEDYYASQGGDIQYGVKANKISQTNPGVFFYFSGLSEAIKGVDNVNNTTLLAGSDGKADMVKIVVDQSVSGITTFSTNLSSINLYKINDANHNGLIDIGETATKVNLTNSQVVIANGDVTINFKPDTVGSLYVLSVKYSTGSVVGSSVPTKPTFEYDFDTMVNNVLIASEAGSITLAPKTNALTLDGEVGQGAHAVSQPQLSHVFDMAVQYWAEHGASSDQLALIKGADVSITDLGGLWLADTTAEGGIRIDDDAAGHGWSLGLGNVAPNKVDLLSALTHEMGHLLGLTHEQMDPELAVGERVLPMAADCETETPPLNVVGSSDDLHPAHFG